MNPFGKLKKDGLEESSDRLGGFRARDTDIYTGKIKMAYAGKSDGGASSVTLLLDIDGEYRETVYVTNKQGENWFANKQDPTKKVPLPGFTLIDDICLLTTDAGLAEQEMEEKIVKIYNFNEKKDVNTAVLVLTGLLEKEISVGIRQILENKSVKNGNEYTPTAEERTVNTIEKVFHTETKLTVAEARQGLDKGVFWDLWQGKNKGVTTDKRTIKDGVGAPSAGRPGRPTGAPVAQGNAGSTAKKSLFGNKAA